MRGKEEGERGEITDSQPFCHSITMCLLVRYSPGKQLFITVAHLHPSGLSITCYWDCFTLEWHPNSSILPPLGGAVSIIHQNSQLFPASSAPKNCREVLWVSGIGILYLTASLFNSVWHPPCGLVSAKALYPAAWAKKTILYAWSHWLSCGQHRFNF